MKKKHVIIAIVAIIIIIIIGINCSKAFTNKDNSSIKVGDSTNSDMTTKTNEDTIKIDDSTNESSDTLLPVSSKDSYIEETSSPETIAPETTKPEETTTNEFTSPETIKPEETEAPNITQPEETTNPETSAPETTKSEETSVDNTIIPETTQPEETEAPHIHNYGSWTTITKATCTEEGSKTRKCVCGSIEYEDIPAKGHSFKWVITKEATESSEGVKSYKCKTCGHVDKTEIIPKVEIKTYHTEWGTRPYEFEPIHTDSSYLGFYFHMDRYGNTWWDTSISSNGKGKQIYNGLCNLYWHNDIVLYFGNGRWCGSGYYWDEDGLNEGSFSVNDYTWPSSWGDDYEEIHNDAPYDDTIIDFLFHCEFYRQTIGSGDEKLVQLEFGFPDEICSIIESGNYSELQNYFLPGKQS